MIRLKRSHMLPHANCPTCPEDFPKVVALIGSSRFKDKFHEEAAKLEKQGVVVLMMGSFDFLGETNKEEWENIEKGDRARIDLCDEVFVISEQGYIGISTFNEILYAKRQGVKVSFMESSAEESFNGNTKRLQDVVGDNRENA